MKSGSQYRLVFMGTPDFAVASLRALYEAGYLVAAVVTAPDKPKGRELKLSVSPVKAFALANQLPVLQPDDLAAPGFVQVLRELNADLFVVVAFRKLPEDVWSLPPDGTINLHASLLPQFRGAAPINWAIMYGEKVTGVTTFFIEAGIDTGRIIMQENFVIPDGFTAGQLHDELMYLGARLLVDTVEAIRLGKVHSIPQHEFTGIMPLRKAPKITREHRIINWDDPCEKITRQVRGLSPVPGAFTGLMMNDNSIIHLKILNCHPSGFSGLSAPGMLYADGSLKSLFASAGDGCVEITELQAEGRKKMSAGEFLRGFRITEPIPLLSHL